jgi:hypothetical protein
MPADAREPGSLGLWHCATQYNYAMTTIFVTLGDFPWRILAGPIQVPTTKKRPHRSAAEFREETPVTRQEENQLSS